MSVTFYYSTMGGGKSLYALQMNHALTEKGHISLLMKSAIDTRDPGVIKSRIGLEKPCMLITPEQDTFLFKLQPQYILVDEAQFLTKANIIALIKYADYHNIELIFFGLKTTSGGELFDGAATILAFADNILELPFISEDRQKAIMHVRYVDGVPVFNGDKIVVGGDETYDSVSRKEWFDLYEKSLRPKFQEGDRIQKINKGKTSGGGGVIESVYEAYDYWCYSILWDTMNFTIGYGIGQIDPKYELS